MSTIKEVVSERCKDSQWFDLNNELVILPVSVKGDDDPLLEDDDFLRLAKATGEGYQYPGLPKISLPSPYYKLDDPFPYPTKFIARIGQSGRNYVDERVDYICLEADLQDEHTTTGIPAADLHRIEADLSALPFCDVRNSTGGGGLHVRIEPAKPISAQERSDYTAAIDHALTLLDSRYNLSLRDKVDTTACSTTATTWTLLTAVAEWSNSPNKGGKSSMLPRVFDFIGLIACVRCPPPNGVETLTYFGNTFAPAKKIGH